jgi:Gpi18-like mannosyltransferase
MGSIEPRSASPGENCARRRWDRDLTSWYAVAACVALWLAATASAGLFIHVRNEDLSDFVIPWYEYLATHGRFAALGAEFTDYTPPYLYLLGLATYTEGALDPAAAIRLINVPFILFASWIIYRLALRSGRGKRAAGMAALLFAALPETVMNGIVWGQSDIIFTSFVLGFLLLLLEERTWLAALMLSIAFTIKLQTIFIAPLVLALLLLRRLSWWQLICGPIVYVLLVLPAAIAGRPWQELLTIYIGQISDDNTKALLSLNAANPYLLIQRVLPPELFDTAVIVAVVLAVFVGLAMAIAFVIRPPRTPATILLCATICLLVMPFVLPKMHERYFFLADATAFALAVSRPGAWRVVVLLQLTAVLTCSTTLGLQLHLSMLGTALVAMAIFLLLRLFVEQPAVAKIGAGSGRLTLPWVPRVNQNARATIK